ncbi:hypothetical protein [Acetobacter persici]|nr:hypothetical protein [Acetobacter persici]MBS1015770.1 hypothetical protein [Acetobacter persici]
MSRLLAVSAAWGVAAADDHGRYGRDDRDSSQGAARDDGDHSHPRTL